MNLLTLGIDAAQVSTLYSTSSGPRVQAQQASAATFVGRLAQAALRSKQQWQSAAALAE
jgi:hypothetical protein